MPTLDEMQREAASNAFRPPAIIPNNSTAMAIAEQAKAAVQARYLMALHRPRDEDAVRQRMVKECSRPTFANDKSALYRKPIGAGVEGLGIRFVEMAFRCMTNILSESVTVHDDDTRRTVRVAVTDLESNYTDYKDITVSKTVERQKPMDDGSYISHRKNSYGKDVFTVPANDDEIINKENALVSKAIRTLGLRMIPGDLQEECETIIRRIRKDTAAKDPDATRRAIIDAFASLNIGVDRLKEYIGHDLADLTPAEMVTLRATYGALAEGEATWATVMQNKREQDVEKPAAKAEPKRAEPPRGLAEPKIEPKKVTIDLAREGPPDMGDNEPPQEGLPVAPPTPTRTVVTKLPLKTPQKAPAQPSILDDDRQFE